MKPQHECPQCGVMNWIVNQCRCDPNNLPTRVPDPGPEFGEGATRLELLMAVSIIIVAAAWGTCANAWRWIKLRRVCSWCKDRLGGNPLAWVVSHGICERCRKAQMAKLRLGQPMD